MRFHSVFVQWPALSVYRQEVDEGQDQGGGGGEEEEETDMPTTLEAALSHLGLTELTQVFLSEQFDFDSLVSLQY